MNVRTSLRLARLATLTPAEHDALRRAHLRFLEANAPRPLPANGAAQREKDEAGSRPWATGETALPYPTREMQEAWTSATRKEREATSLRYLYSGDAIRSLPLTIFVATPEPRR